MVLTINSRDSKETIKKTLANLKLKGKLDAKKHSGKIKLKDDPLDIQKSMRNEW